MVQKVEIVRGTSNTLSIAVTDANGNPYTIVNGETVIFGVKKKVTDEELLIKKAAFVEDSGVYTIRLYPEDTKNMPCGAYCYDVGLQSGENFYNIIETSPFVIHHEITKWGVLND